MKICFWSPVRGRAGVTTNLACISALAAIGKKGKIYILENHYSTHGIGDILMEQETVDSFREHGEYHSCYGIEYLLKRMYLGEPGEKLIHHSAIPLLFSSLFYIPQGRIVNKEVFNYEFRMAYEKVFQALESHSEYIFIDTETNQNLSSNIILSHSDLIVVNLPQDEEQLAVFFQENQSIQEKAVYLIGGYQEGTSCNMSYICREYKISRDRIGIIPYNLELEEAMSNGHLLQFLNRNYFQAEDRENEYLIRYAKRAVRMIQKNALRRVREQQKYRLFLEEREIAF